MSTGDYNQNGNNILDESVDILVQEDELNFPEPFAEEMRPVLLNLSNKELNRAGSDLVSWRPLQGGEIFDNAYDKVSKLRLAHAYPLRAVTSILRQKALAIDPAATVYSRSKRVGSIMRKLARIRTMKLTTMQDLGGCRAVLFNIDSVNKLISEFRVLKPKLGDCDESDYIKEPKEDGYRSFHFVVRFKSKSHIFSDVAARRIEVQLRSRLQHQWATALETIDLFTEQTLKTGGGRSSWRRFFVLAADLLALKEGCPRIVGSIRDENTLRKELTYWWDWLAIEDLLGRWATAVYKDIPIDPGENYNYLIETDIEARKTSVKSFPPDQLKQSYEEYGAAEIRNKDSASRSAVLVSAYSLGQLREAFLSYYGDTTDFVETMKNELEI